MQPRKKVTGKKWENPKFDKGLIAPIERFLHKCEEKGLQVDSEIDDWLHDIIQHTYSVAKVNERNAIYASLKRNVGDVFNAITKDAGTELDKMHAHLNKNIK